jgi:hypothetical protein
MCVKENKLAQEPGGVQYSTRVQKFEVRLPDRRLRCACGHWVAAYDYELIETGTIRTICSGCHQELMTVELSTEVLDGALVP